MLPGQSWRVLSHLKPGRQEDSLRMADIGPLTTMGAVLAYAVFEWGGVLRSDQYHYLLVLGLLAVMLSLARPRDQWAPLPDRAVRWTLALLPAYMLMQVVPLPVVAAACALTLASRGAWRRWTGSEPRVNFASLSVSPAATFQSFLLVCGYVIVFLLVRELTWRFDDRRWLAIWPIVAIGALEAALGLCQNFGGAWTKPGGGRTSTTTTTRASWRWRCRLRWCTPWPFGGASARVGTRAWLRR